MSNLDRIGAITIPLMGFLFLFECNVGNAWYFAGIHQDGQLGVYVLADDTGGMNIPLSPPTSPQAYDAFLPATFNQTYTGAGDDIVSVQASGENTITPSQMQVAATSSLSVSGSTAANFVTDVGAGVGFLVTVSAGAGSDGPHFDSYFGKVIGSVSPGDSVVIDTTASANFNDPSNPQWNFDTGYMTINKPGPFAIGFGANSPYFLGMPTSNLIQTLYISIYKSAGQGTTSVEFDPEIGSQVVPEPSGFVLLALGGLLCQNRIRNRFKLAIVWPRQTLLANPLAISAFGLSAVRACGQ